MMTMFTFIQVVYCTSVGNVLMLTYMTGTKYRQYQYDVIN